jgi:hypothetical protein
MARSRVIDPEFLVSPAGRLSRSAFGAALIVAGRAIGGRAGGVLVVLGVVPIVNSALGVVAVGPLIGADLRGRPRRQHPVAVRPGEPGPLDDALRSSS